MNVEIEHDGKKCTKFLIDGKSFEKNVYELDIHVEGGRKPIMIMKTDVDNLKINGKDIQVFKHEEEKKEEIYE